MSAETKTLRRGRQRIIGGVCSGLAEYFGVDVVLVRVAFVGLALLSGAGILLYVVLWLLMPNEEASAASGVDAIRGGLKSMREDVDRIASELKKPAT